MSVSILGKPEIDLELTDAEYHTEVWLRLLSVINACGPRLAHPALWLISRSLSLLDQNILKGSGVTVLHQLQVIAHTLAQLSISLLLY